MSKRLVILMALLATTAFALPASAQMNQPGGTPPRPTRTLPGQKAPAQKVNPLKAFPALKMKTLPRGVKSPFSQPTIPIRPQLPINLLKVNPDLTMWGNLLTNDLLGIYSFHPTANVNFDALADYYKGYFNAGSGIVGDDLHGLFLDTSYSSYGIVKLIHYSFNTKTWELVGQPEEVSDLSLTATETATDPATGEIFGQFFTPDLSAYEWGVIDYATLKRTTIAPALHKYVALGVANDGFAYGVTSEGDFYQIDRTTGAETLKGSTGVQVSDRNGQYYTQSGEFDPRTNEFYWASTDKDGKFQLYTIDLSNGHVTPIGSYTETASIMALTIPTTPIANGAPAAATNLSSNFVNAATHGTFTFTAPNKKFDGSNLSGTLSYTVFANGIEVATGNAEAGNQTTINANVAEGVVNFIVVFSNDAGKGPRAKLTTYAGYDTPNIVSNLKLTVDESGNAVVTWDAPTAGTHQGYLGNITYDVYRNVDSATENVASDISTTTFSEVIPMGKLSCYTYSVRANNTTRSSALATTDGQVFGEALDVPFFDDLLTEADSKLYTILDKNHDGSSWEWSNAKGGLFQYKFNKDNAGDDWLISPPIRMKQGRTYNVSFKAAAGLKDFAERMEVKWGADKTAEAMTGVILQATEIAGVNNKTFTGKITPTADGNYYLGFHAISEPDRYAILIDSISVEGAADAKAPAAVDNLIATADQTGALKVTLKFNAPTTTVDGTVLSSITKIDVKSGDRLVKSIVNPTPGSEQLLVDNAAVNGENFYTIIAYNAYDYGKKATAKVYVGQDTPVMGKVKAFDQTTAVKLKWEVPAGAHNGVILPSEISYKIHNIGDDGKLGEEIGKVKGITEYVVTGLNNNEGEQKYQRWAINAENVAGPSNWVAGTLVVGAPYTLPFHNSFKGGTIENQFIGLESSGKNTMWAVTNDVSSDNDNGSIIFRPSETGVSTILTGKIALQGSMNPKLVFDYRGDGSPKAKVELRFGKKDGSMTEPVWTNTEASTNGKWKTYRVDIPTELIGEDYVSLRIIGIADDIADDAVHLDNINIADPFQKDAAIALVTPESVKKGQTIKLNVKVTNLGLDNIENAKVAVSVDGKVVKEEAIEKSLSLLQYAELPITCTTTSLNKAAKLKVKVTLIVDNDLDPENNEAEAVVKLETPNVLAPQNLKSTGSTSSMVKLTWDSPASTTTETTDRFEDYDPWSTKFGAWATVDNDHGYAGELVSGIQYPHQGEQFAFINWQPADIFNDPQEVAPHSGEKAAVAVYQIDDMGNDYLDADNWLISPQLSGKAQTIRFWVNNLKPQDNSYGTEIFDVLASMTNNETSSFVKIGDTHVQGSGTWTEISVEVPEGTKFFAIHHITSKDNVFAFMVDDAVFEAGDGPISYNVYRDGELVSSTYKTNCDDQPTTNGNHKYSVTAVYADGAESEPVEVEVATAVQQINANGEIVYDVYAVDGKLIIKGAKNLNFLSKGVYIVNGKKVVVK